MGMILIVLIMGSILLFNRAAPSVPPIASSAPVSIPTFADEHTPTQTLPLRKTLADIPQTLEPLPLVPTILKLGLEE